ncbi:MAG TPA: hypothetical protein VLQ45_02165 [Thermoanaerobaculia bacterium]|nr:hypothetical protein [Thermoanaerobaculia bacterium]
MYGIKAAVRRLDFAPEAKDMEVIDVTTGRFVFKPRPGKTVSLAALEKAITQAGYEIEKTRIEVRGQRTDGDRLRVPETGQVFRLAGEKQLPAEASGGLVTVAGGWRAEGDEQIVQLDEPRTGEEKP